jgi:hypothetical protein
MVTSLKIGKFSCCLEKLWCHGNWLILLQNASRNYWRANVVGDHNIWTITTFSKQYSFFSSKLWNYSRKTKGSFCRRKISNYILPKLKFSVHQQCRTSSNDSVILINVKVCVGTDTLHCYMKLCVLRDRRKPLKVITEEFNMGRKYPVSSVVNRALHSWHLFGRVFDRKPNRY